MSLKALLLLGAAAYAKAQPSCCDAITKAAPGQVFSPVATDANSTYAILNHNRWSDTTILAPSCIFQPTSPEGLGKGLKVIVAGSCQFAIKSGGHNPNPGMNNINNGISIDMGKLNQKVASPDKKVVHLGAGGTWGAAYGALFNSGVGFTGGLCGGTGIGGVSLGGGAAFFTARNGWVVDNVVNYEVVLASGKVVNANQSCNSDLFKALKGGSANFGIVTRTDLATFKQSQIWAGQIIVPLIPPIVNATASALTQVTALNNEHTEFGVQAVVTYPHNQDPVIIFSIADADNVVNATGLKPLLSLQPQILNTMRTTDMVGAVAELDQNQANGFRDAAASVAFVNDPATFLAVQNITDTVYAHIKEQVADLDFVLFYTPLPKVVQTHSAARGGNVLGLTGRKNDLIMAFITPRWKDAKYDDLMATAAQKWYEEVQKVTNAMGTGDRFIYYNFAHYTQKPICGYGAENVRFMQQVAAKYDPTGVFQRLSPGGFKVSAAC